MLIDLKEMCSLLILYISPIECIFDTCITGIPVIDVSNIHYINYFRSCQITTTTTTTSALLQHMNYLLGNIIITMTARVIPIKYSHNHYSLINNNKINLIMMEFVFLN